ncbi:hypothetical protein FQF49_17480 [Escherichia coli]|nr:hypothetical protein [Escherichia coli]
MDEGSLSLPPFTGYDEKSQRNYHLALRGNSLNPMIDAATPLLGMVMRLSTMNSQTMPEHLFAQVVTDVQAVEQLLQEQGYEPGVIISFRYILCTFIDEAALGNGWSNKNEWIKQSLLVHFHNEAWGGEKVFILLERLIREVDWRDSVVKPFNEQLANNYPFNPRSAQDASLDAFERFFKPDGILDTFYQQNLKLFIDNDLSLEDGDNNVIIREDIIAQLETAQKIRDIFFSKQNGLGTSFAVETVSLSGNKRRSVLNLDGQLVDYSQGRNYTAHLVWPNNMREGNESKLTLIGTSGNAPRSISFSGPWAQFRLFGAGQLTGVQDGNFTVRFSVDGGAMTYRVHTDTEDNPFSGGLFSQFGLSDTLY